MQLVRKQIATNQSHLHGTVLVLKDKQANNYLSTAASKKVHARALAQQGAGRQQLVQPRPNRLVPQQRHATAQAKHARIEHKELQIIPTMNGWHLIYLGK
jgi:hypothetical protein